MIRLIVLLIALIALAGGTIWLSQNPGDMVIHWFGYEIRTSAAIAFAAMLVVAFVVVTLLLMASGILRSARNFNQARLARKRRKGYHALSRGLLAVAAGAGPEARRYARDAEKHLDDPRLTLFLTAQAAELEGDRSTAAKLYGEMLNDSETEYLGLRALFLHAREEGDRERALKLARRALEIRPSTGWAAQAEFELETAEEDWIAAQKTVEKAVSAKLITRDEGRHRRALLLTAQAMEAEQAALAQAGSGREPALKKALELAREAHGYEPHFPPTVAITARLERRMGHPRRGAKAIEEAWAHFPHPDLAEEYAHLKGDETAYERLGRVKALAEKKPGHLESRIALARAAIGARDWRLAREALEAYTGNVVDEPATRRVCELMAMIEDGELGNRGKAREWLARGLHAPEDPTWIGEGYSTEIWTPISPLTGKFDVLEWKVPSKPLPKVNREASAFEPATALAAMPTDPKAPESKMSEPKTAGAAPTATPTAAQSGEEAAPSIAPEAAHVPPAAEAPIGKTAESADEARPAKPDQATAVAQPAAPPEIMSPIPADSDAPEEAGDDKRFVRAPDDPGPDANDPYEDETPKRKTWW